MFSPRSETPPTSPIQNTPQSSPVQYKSEPPSSPVSPCGSSPASSEKSSSSCESIPAKRQKKYEFNDLLPPQDPLFWPHDVKRNEDDGSRTGTEVVMANAGITIPDDEDAEAIKSVGFIEVPVCEHLNIPISTGNDEENINIIGNGVTVPGGENPSQYEDTLVLTDVSDSSDSSDSEAGENENYDYKKFEDEKRSDSRTSQSSSSSHESETHDEEKEMHGEERNIHGKEKETQDEERENFDNEGEISDTDSESSVSDVKIYRDSDLSLREGVLILMDLFLRNKLTKTALGEITVSLQNFLLKGNYMPKNKYQLLKYISDRCPPVPVTTHYYCKVCLFYLGKEEKNCHLCNNSSKKFYQLCLETQIRNLFEHHNLADLIDKYAEKRRNMSSQGSYSDVCDGSEYQRAHRGGRYDITFLGHTDGISISDSSEVSLWPLEWVILEIPHYSRFKYLIISEVWVDDSHPYMNCFLRPFVDELKELYTKGVKWIHPKTKKEEVSYVVAPVFCGDGPVRADIQNILYHGGRHCCHLCEQKMTKLDPEPIPEGCTNPPKRKRVFQFLETPSKLRTAERMDAQGQLTLNLQQVNRKAKPVKGVKGYTVVSELPMCDRSTVVYPEYMHLLIGIIKQFLEFWFHGDIKDASLKQHRSEINQFLNDVRVPDFVTRTPRSVDCYSSWKANELRTFVLYLSLIILSKFMKEEYLQHWMLLVSALYLYLQESIPDHDVTRAEIMIRIFLRDFPRLYDKKKFTYNLHELSHLGIVTRLWGPAFLNSAFWFEGFNGLLSQYIHGTKEQGQELINTIQLIQAVQKLKARSPLNDKVGSKSLFVLKNRVDEYKFDANQKQLLKSSGFVKPIYVFYRATRNGEDFTSSIYTRQEKGNNYTICYRNLAGNEEYGEISSFVSNGNSGDENDKKMAFLNPFIIDHKRMFIHKDTQFVVPHIIPIKESTVYILIPMENILFKVLRVDDFICLRPNKIESNL